MSALYKKKYGAWAGLPHGRAPDLTRCCVEVNSYIGRSSHFHQCNRKRGYGPEQAYCKQHDPVAVAARDAAAKEKYDKSHQARRIEWAGGRFLHVLRQIANGRNDPRAIAAEAIKDFPERTDP
jgi:hypothetical protein